jgi:hypothetical protein
LACIVFGAALLSGCNAAANAPQASALMVAPQPGGVLACYGQRLQGATGNTVTQLDFTNNNDEGTISIDRLVVYRANGSIACQDLEPRILEPHSNRHYNTERSFPQCGDWLPEPTPGTHSLSFIVYWSHKGLPNAWARNALVGVTDVTHTTPDQQVVRTAFECKPIFLKPDPCAGITCRTVSICGTDAPCETCVNGRCVPNEPHFNAACLPSCGAAGDFCGVAGVCGWTSGQCLQSYDCATCCTQP